MTEYLPIPEFPGYRVGDNGEVQSAWVRKSNGGRNGTRTEIGSTWKPIVPRTHSKGYLLVSMRDLSGSRRLKYVHHIVLELFRGPRPAGAFGCHRDDNPKNNDLHNLRWDTPLANQIDWRGSIATIAINGVEKTLSEWARESSASARLIRFRLKRGWAPKDAVFRPPAIDWGRPRKGTKMLCIAGTSPENRRRYKNFIREHEFNWCWICGRDITERPDWWHAAWTLHRAHIVRSPRIEDPRVIIICCPFCHEVFHGIRFAEYDRPPITVAHFLWAKKQLDPANYDREFLRRYSVQRLPRPAQPPAVYREEYARRHAA